MKNILKKFFVCINTNFNFIFIFNFMLFFLSIFCFDLFCATEIYIPYPMFLKALNNSMDASQNNFVKKSEKEIDLEFKGNSEQDSEFRNFEDKNKFKDKNKNYVRDDFQEIFEEDVSNVLRLKADNMGILDISGIENFTSIISTIDVSNNNISDISPLLKWVLNKKEVLAQEDKKLKVNIFLGGNERLFSENSSQIYELIEMGERIYIYDSQRNGEGVVDLPGFVNGRPAQMAKFSDDSSEFDKSFSKTTENQSKNQSESQIENQSEILNTGKFSVMNYILLGLILGISFILFFRYIKANNKTK